MKLFLVGGARPNFMKIAPLVHQLQRTGPSVEWQIIHTGQHYDYELSKVFFEDFDIPEPHHFLDAGSGSHAEQTARVMVAFENVCVRERPDVVVVVGDVNSTLACSVTAKKMLMHVAHVEAGLRSGDMTMPEEINRIVTDSIADYLFVTEKSGIDNLRKEGKDERQVYFVGNIMIDTLHYCLRKLEQDQFKKDSGHMAGEQKAPYAVVTLHRPSNVDRKETLEGILRALNKISGDMRVHFPVHPRTKKNMELFELNGLLKTADITLSPPLSYLEFLRLWKDAALVLTDSGGLQEETTALGIPCFTIRENTERPITIEQGTNTLVGTTEQGILKAYERFRSGKKKQGRIPELWDGRTGERVIRILMESQK